MEKPTLNNTPQTQESKKLVIGEIIQHKSIEISQILSYAQIDCITNQSEVKTVGGTKNSLYYQEKFKKEKFEGMSSPIDIYDCNLELIQSQKHIQQYIDELCREMKWEKIGTTYMKYFDNEDPGITCKQRTDQGIVSAHFKDLTVGACFDIHSRTYFDPNIVAKYTKQFFQGGKTILDTSYRKPKNIQDNSDKIQTTGGLKSIDYYRKEYESRNLWGMSSAIDINDCDIEKIAFINNLSVEQYIKQFVSDLCEAIDMITDGETQVDEITHHGKQGIEFTQVITTSLISGHFRSDTQNAYFEIFSCKFYDPNFVAQFVKRYFQGGATKIYVSYRGTV